MASSVIRASRTRSTIVKCRPVVGALSLAAALGTFAGAAHAKDFLDIRARDQCDPVTFNAGRANPLCSPSHAGSVTLQEFLDALPNGGHDAWKFNPGPSGAHIDRGGTVQVRSDAGETHTFTKVVAFGGGAVPALNVEGSHSTSKSRSGCAHQHAMRAGRESW